MSFMNEYFQTSLGNGMWVLTNMQVDVPVVAHDYIYKWRWPPYASEKAKLNTWLLKDLKPKDAVWESVVREGE